MALNFGVICFIHWSPNFIDDMKKLIGVFAFLTFFTIHAQTLEQGLDSLVLKVNQSLGIDPGISIGVIRDNKVILQKSYGYANINTKQKATPTTPFYIASTTKSLVAAVAKKLEEEKRLRLDEPISTYLPEFVFKDSTSLTKHMTLRRLLTHTSGIQNEAITWRTAYTGENAHDNAKLLELFANSSFGRFSFAYSNHGYILAAVVMEKITGQQWQDLLREKIFKPLTMGNTAARISELYNGNYSKSIEAVGHSVRDGKYKVGSIQKTDVIMHAAGGVYSSSEDMLKWLQYNMAGEYNKKKLLSRSSFSDLHKVQQTLDSKFFTYERFGYDLGWYHSRYEGDTLVQCFGSFAGGSRAHTSFMPKHKIGIVVLTNAFPEGVYLPDILANYIYDRLLNKQGLSKKFEEEVKNYPQLVSRFKSTPFQPFASEQADDFSGFEGHYFNQEFGTIHVIMDGDQRQMKWGIDGLVKSDLLFEKKSTYRLSNEVFSSQDYLKFSQGTDGSPFVILHVGSTDIPFNLKK